MGKILTMPWKDPTATENGSVIHAADLNQTAMEMMNLIIMLGGVNAPAQYTPESPTNGQQEADYLKEALLRGEWAIEAPTSAADAYVVAVANIPGLTGATLAYKTELRDGMRIHFRVGTGNGNTGPSTLNAFGLGTFPLKKDGGINDIAAGDMLDGSSVEIEWNAAGNFFELISSSARTSGNMGAIDIFATTPQYIQAARLEDPTANRRALRLKKDTVIRLDVDGVPRYGQQISEEVVLAETILASGSTLTPGADYYIYEVPSGAGTRKIIDTNASFPSGYTANNSRKVGGFCTLCGTPQGLPTNHPAYGYQAGDIVPTSVWTTKFRPRNDTRGMVYDTLTGDWFPHYPLDGNGVSLYNVAPAGSSSGIGAISIYDAVDICAKNNLEMFDYELFQSLAAGSPENVAVNGAAESSVLLTGMHQATNGRTIISNKWLLDMVGCRWTCLKGSGLYNTTATPSWQDVGKGSVYDTDNRGTFGGGSWIYAAFCGPRCRVAGPARSYASVDHGARGRSRALHTA